MGEELRIMIVGVDSRLGGGMPTVTHGLMRELIRFGADVRLLESQLGLPNGADPQVTVDGATYRIAIPGAKLHDTRDVLRDCGDPRAEQAFRLVLKDWPPDLVFFAHLGGLGMSLIQVANQKRLPVLVYVGDYYLMCPTLKLFHPSFGECVDSMQGLGCSRCTTGGQQLAPVYGFRLNFARDLLQRSATLILAQSQAARRALLRFGLPAEKVRVSRPGIAGGRIMPRRKRARGEPVAFAFLGNVGYPKGCHLLIEAFLKLRQGAASLTFYGGGDSEYLRQLQKQAGGRVTFAGPYQADELPGIMQRIDVGVVPSIWQECGPLVVSEFLHYGVPVVGNDIGGIPEQLVAGEDGLLATPGDVKALAGAMTRFLDEPELLARMPASRARLRTFAEWAAEIISFASNFSAGGATPDPEQPTADRESQADLEEAEAFKNQGRLEASVDRVEAILAAGDLDPKARLRCHLLAGESLARLGKAAPARRHLAAGLEREPENVDFLVAAGSLELAEGQVESADAFFSRAREKEAANDRVLCGLGLSLLQRGEKQEALEQLVAALELNPENLTALCGLTAAAYGRAELSVLETHLRNYLAHHPGDCDILYSLAGCLFAQGRQEEAAGELGKILALRPDHELALELMEKLDCRDSVLAGEAAAGRAG